MIPKKILKTEIMDLPLGQFGGEIVLVDNLSQVKDVIKELSGENLIGFDTETRPSFTKGRQHQVALLQLATKDIAFLIRLNQIGMPGVIRELLETKQVVKIGAAVRDDLKALGKLREKFAPQSFYDLNEELKRVGFENVGVRNLAAMVLNMRISKSEQVSNWEAPVLSEKQLLYAATDAWVCLEIYNKLSFQGYLEETFNQ
ncbi:3'-5' exonuclease [Aquiflexum sp.]|uniref:3'-5' exonuclease n=1 Tax=Aquiflexum sp. TaxID=1872584 RepID=UPI0035944319